MTLEELEKIAIEKGAFLNAIEQQVPGGGPYIDQKLFEIKYSLRIDEYVIVGFKPRLFHEGFQVQAPRLRDQYFDYGAFCAMVARLAAAGKVTSTATFRRHPRWQPSTSGGVESRKHAQRNLDMLIEPEPNPQKFGLTPVSPRPNHSSPR